MASYYDTTISTSTNYVNWYFVSTTSASTTYAPCANNFVYAGSSCSRWSVYDAAAALDSRQRKFDNDNAPAAARARKLLLAVLTREQRRSFEREGWFIVRGGKSGKRYRIRNEGSICANIDVLADNDNGCVVHRLCAHCEPASVPTCDQLLAQKIKIEYDEEDFLRVANRHAA